MNGTNKLTFLKAYYNSRRKDFFIFMEKTLSYFNGVWTYVSVNVEPKMTSFLSFKLLLFFYLKQINTEAQKEIKEKKVRNKIKINPPQGVTEGFRELGGVVVEMYELTEKIDIEKADMGDVIKDFRKSDAPQFKGKSDKKKQQMAIAAKLEADESYDMSKAPSIKDAKPAKKVNVKYDPKMKVMAPQINKEETEEEKKKRELITKTKEHDDKKAGKVAEATLVSLKKRLNSEEMSIKDQMRISREAAKKRNPNPDHRKINAMKASNQKKDNRTDAQKMSDATGPRPGSNYRGD